VPSRLAEERQSNIDLTPHPAQSKVQVLVGLGVINKLFGRPVKLQLAVSNSIRDIREMAQCH